jgi:hypothetical protein
MGNSKNSEAQEKSQTPSTKQPQGRIEDEPAHRESAEATERALNIGARTKKAYN